jgi:hypothetical protein
LGPSDEQAASKVGAKNGKIQKGTFRRKPGRVDASTRVNAEARGNRSLFASLILELIARAKEAPAAANRRAHSLCRAEQDR